MGQPQPTDFFIIILVAIVIGYFLYWVQKRGERHRQETIDKEQE